MRTLISIKIPVFNTKNTLQSIVEQKSKYIKILAIKNGRFDKIEDILNDFTKKNEYIKNLKISNSNTPYARYLGIQKSIGRYIWFFDSDCCNYINGGES